MSERDLRARAAKATQSAICEHEIQGRITDDTAQELGMLLDEAISALTRLQEWQTIVMNGGDIARDRFVAGQYLKPVVDSWKAEVAKRETEVHALKAQLAEAKDKAKGLQLCWDTEKRLNRSLDHQSAVLDDVRRQLAEAQADNAALVTIFEKVRDAAGHTVRCIRFKESEGCPLCLLLGAQETLSQPHPGASMTDELAALRKVERVVRATLAKSVVSDATYGETSVSGALTELDAIRNRKEPANG